MLRRRDDFRLPAAALAIVLLADLFWATVEGSTGTITYGFVDEPAHLATCVLALCALAVASGARLPRRFVVAALLGSVAIDLDHVPGFLGSHLLTGSLPRPYTHSLLLVLALLAVAVALRRVEQRQLWLGLAFGVSTHLFRDLATGPGISFFWPLDEAAIQIPYAFYAGVLVVLAATCLPRHSLPPLRRAFAAVLIVGVAAMALAASASARQIALGTYVRGVEEHPSLIDRYAKMVGSPPAIVGAFKRWDVRPFYAPELRQIASRGAVPLISWEPWNAEDHGYRLAAIARGRHDGYIRRSAREAKRWGGPILVRFGQEMNGTWAPWERGQDGTTAGNFVAAWRHVVTIFRRVGASNVRWVWCPYVSNGHNHFMAFYPGSNWVDWVALDGYNWGTPRPWQSFGEIFDRSYRVLARIAPRKPMMIAEIGSNEAGGNKASWLSAALDRQLPRLKKVRAVVWFDAVDGADFRVNSSPGALEAFRAGIHSPLYSGSGRWVARIALGS